MSSISGVEAKFPPGFRFHPWDDELICDYLMRKITQIPSDSRCPLIPDVDLNKCEPWDIPEATCVGGKEWYFYSHLDRKYMTGSRTNRATASGYWKSTGKDRAIVRKGALVGMRKTLVFYRGRAHKGRKTNWVMHEFRVEGSLNHLKDLRLLKDEWVLCRVFHKSGDVVAKPVIEGDADRLSPPPLMDPNLIFNQRSTGHHEQVPCFSKYTVNQGDPLFVADTGLFQPRTLPSYTDMYSGITDSGSSLDLCDERVTNSVPSHLTRMERIPGFEESVNPVQGSFPPRGVQSFVLKPYPD